MTEPAVTLTDYALALECGLFAYLVRARRGAASGLRPWLVLFFASASAAPLFGGTVHGFFLDEASVGYAVLWPATLLSIGVTATSGWVIGAHLLFRGAVVRGISIAAAIQLIAYTALVLFVTQAFWIAVVDYLPAALFLLVCLVIACRRERARSLGWAAFGLGLTFVAAAIQQLRIAVHAVHFDHNALYHVLQGVALFLIFLGARWLALARAA